jgi:hypothetical protein
MYVDDYTLSKIAHATLQDRLRIAAADRLVLYARRAAATRRTASRVSAVITAPFAEALRGIGHGLIRLSALLHSPESERDGCIEPSGLARHGC